MSETEKKIAEFLVGELPPGRRDALQVEIESDPQARSLLKEMRRTTDALSAWSESFASLPVPQLPRRRRFPLLKIASLAAAAVVIVSLLLIFTSNPPVEPPPKVTVIEKTAEEKLAEELAWVREIAAGALPQGSEKTSFAAAPAPPPGAPGAPSAPGAPGAPAAADDAGLQKRLEVFAGRFDFRFRIPPRLEGDFKIAEGVLISKEQAMLVYKSKDEKKEITVFLGKSAGPDTGFVPLKEPARIPGVQAARKSGIAVSFKGIGIDKQGAEALAKHFLPERDKEKEEEE